MKRQYPIFIAMSLLCATAGAMEDEGKYVEMPRDLHEGVERKDGEVPQNFYNAVNPGNWFERPGLGVCVKEQYEKYNLALEGLKRQSGPQADQQRNMKRSIIQNAIAECWREHPKKAGGPVQLQQSKEESKEVINEIREEAKKNPEEWSWCDPRTWSCFKQPKLD